MDTHSQRAAIQSTLRTHCSAHPDVPSVAAVESQATLEEDYDKGAIGGKMRKGWSNYYTLN